MQMIYPLGEEATREIHAFGLIPKKLFPPEESDMQNANHPQLQELIQKLNLLRSEMLELETSGLVGCADVHPEHRASAKNLMHYLALRRHDIRRLQSQLATLDLSSLGRTEPHEMSSFNAMGNLLGGLTGSDEACVQPLNGAPGSTKALSSLDWLYSAGRTCGFLLPPAPGCCCDCDRCADLRCLI